MDIEKQVPPGELGRGDLGGEEWYHNEYRTNINQKICSYDAAEQKTSEKGGEEVSKQKVKDIEIADRIVECREKCKYTQQDMEERTGLSVNTISSAENCGDFKVSTLLLMVNAFREKLGDEIEGEKSVRTYYMGRMKKKRREQSKKRPIWNVLRNFLLNCRTSCWLWLKR